MTTHNRIVSQYLDNLYFAENYITNEEICTNLVNNMHSYNERFHHVIDSLLTAGADVTIKNNLQNTALYRLIATYPIEEENRNKILLDVAEMYHDELYKLINNLLTHQQSTHPLITKNDQLTTKDADGYEVVTQTDQVPILTDHSRLLLAATEKKYCNLYIIHKLLAANSNNTIRDINNGDTIAHKVIAAYNDRFKKLIVDVSYYENGMNLSDCDRYKDNPSHKIFMKKLSCIDYTNVLEDIKNYNAIFCAIIDRLSSNRSWTSMQNHAGNTPLYDLITTNAITFPVDARKKTLSSKIGHAYLDTFQKVVDTLLPQSNINIVNNNGDTLLHAATNYHHMNAELIQKLLTARINIHTKNNNGDNCLHHVMNNQRSRNVSEVTDLLIHAGANFNEQNKLGYTPTHYIMDHIKFEEPEFVDKLITAGANINIQNNNGDTPAHILMRETNLNHLNIQKKLVDFNPPLNFTLENKLKKTVLYYAVELKHLGFIQHLLDNPAHADILRNEKRGLMHAATSAPYRCFPKDVPGVIDLVTLLCANNININHVTNFTDPNSMAPDSNFLEIKGTPLVKLEYYMTNNRVDAADKEIIAKLIPVIKQLGGR